MRAPLIRVPAALLASVSLLGATAASADDEPVACTLIGCESAVTVAFSSMPTDAFRAQVCVEDQCAKPHRLVREAGADLATVRLRRCERQAGRRVTVVAPVFDSERELIMSDRTRAKVTRVQPNGPNCPPVCFTVSLELRGDTGRLSRA